MVDIDRYNQNSEYIQILPSLLVPVLLRQQSWFLNWKLNGKPTCHGALSAIGGYFIQDYEALPKLKPTPFFTQLPSLKLTELLVFGKGNSELASIDAAFRSAPWTYVNGSKSPGISGAILQTCTGGGYFWGWVSKKKRCHGTKRKRYTPKENDHLLTSIFQGQAVKFQGGCKIFKGDSKRCLEAIRCLWAFLDITEKKFGYVGNWGIRIY